MSRDTGGSAFPIIPPTDGDRGFAAGYPYPEHGMSLRDYFAGQALPAIIAAACAGQHHPGEGSMAASNEDRIAFDAYRMADAMIAARSAP